MSSLSMVERSFAMSIGILAIIRAGAAYLPLSPENPPDRTEYMLKEAGVALVLAHGKTAAKVAAAFKGTVIDLDDLSLYGSGAPLESRTAPGSRLCDLYVRLDRAPEGRDDRASSGDQPPALDAARLSDRSG